jgi:hypothetical protein
MKEDRKRFVDKVLSLYIPNISFTHQIKQVQVTFSTVFVREVTIFCDITLDCRLPNTLFDLFIFVFEEEHLSKVGEGLQGVRCCGEPVPHATDRHHSFVGLDHHRLLQLIGAEQQRQHRDLRAILERDWAVAHIIVFSP